MKENEVTLQLTDKIENLGDRYYIKATAILTDIETVESIENIAYARECEEKKGMDSSQITGTASSYARKYALNGLFCIDDTRDADTDEYKNVQENKKEKQEKILEEELDMLVTEKQAKLIYSMMTSKGMNVEKQLEKNYQINNTKDLTKRQYASILNAIKDISNKK